MKTKSLFISTIAMVVLLVVALATGTFAWYTANNIVDTNEASIGAAQSDIAAIGLAWGENLPASSISFGGTGAELAYPDLRPMIPKSMPAVGATVALASLPAFNEAILAIDDAPTPAAYVSSTPGATPWTQIDPTYTEDTLNIINLDTANSAYVQVKVTFVPNASTEPVNPDFSNLLRVAVFAETAYQSGSYTFLGVWASTTVYACDLSTLTAVDPDTRVRPSQINVVGNALTGTFASGATSTSYFDLTNSESVTLKVYAWLEGTALTTSNMGYEDALFNINFTASQSQP